jgi:hypothetical protein
MLIRQAGTAPTSSLAAARLGPQETRPSRTPLPARHARDDRRPTLRATRHPNLRLSPHEAASWIDAKAPARNRRARASQDPQRRCRCDQSRDRSLSSLTGVTAIPLVSTLIAFTTHCASGRASTGTPSARSVAPSHRQELLRGRSIFDGSMGQQACGNNLTRSVSFASIPCRSRAGSRGGRLPTMRPQQFHLMLSRRPTIWVSAGPWFSLTWRSRAIVWRRMREICICEQPMRSASPFR